MFTLIMLVLLALLISAGVYLTIRYNIELKKAQGVIAPAKTPVSKKPAHRKAKATITNWRSVKINPGRNCCKAADDMQDKVYLASQAPIFPLPECTIKECSCRYSHLDDRRGGDDRREATEYSNRIYSTSEQDRRYTRDRRVLR